VKTLMAIVHVLVDMIVESDAALHVVKYVANAPLDFLNTTL
jgi:hypothetical protein